jgi:hypothetical protein
MNYVLACIIFSVVFAHEKNVSDRLMAIIVIRKNHAGEPPG